MHNKFQLLSSLQRIRHLTLVCCSTLVTGCATTSDVWERDTLITPQQSSTKELRSPKVATGNESDRLDKKSNGSVVIYMYPQSGSISQGQYYRVYKKTYEDQ